VLDNQTLQTLIESATAARRWAYAPYSNYAVGAALLTTSGKIYEGVNIENAAYPSGICAERVAIFKAVSEGEREFVALVVVTGNGGVSCGACRQVMAEFNLNMRVIAVSETGQVHMDKSVAELLPDAFTSVDLA
jgi:cytidine deaminase